MKFKIKDFKTGKTYKYTINGIKKAGTSKYAKVTGSVKIPATKNNITASKAVSIALNKAGLTKNEVYDLEVEKEKEGGTTFFEVTFDANGFEYEYHIGLKGKVLWSEKERD